MERLSPPRGQPNPRTCEGHVECNRHRAMEIDEDDPDAIILLDRPRVHSADDLIEAELDENDVETEQIVLLDLRRLDDDDIELDTELDLDVA